MDQRVLGDYKIIKQIGQGTLGTVFLGEHRFIKKQYLLKLLPEELASERTFIQRFEEEIGLIATLDHPNIVKIHNISFANGLYFIVSDCIVNEMGETMNLAQYMQGSAPLPEEEVFKILYQMAHALDYAHERGEFVHRNLKPNNVLVGKKKEEAVEVYLSDFGLSSLVGPGAVMTKMYKNMAEALEITAQTMGLKYPCPPIETSKLTPLHHSFLQNYSFLAPEQKRPEIERPVDKKADVYSFGMLAYFLLTKNVPEGVFDFPSAFGSYRFNWDRLIQECLQMLPEKRPAFLLPLLRSIVPQPLDDAKKKVDTISSDQMLKKEEPVIAVVEPKKEEKVEEPAVSLKPVLQTPQLERPVTDLDPGAIFQVQSTVKTYSPELKEISNIKPLLTEMVVVPGGSFCRGSQDGSRDEMPMHSVHLASFAIDIHPVTNEQFVRFLEVMGGEKDTHHNDIIRLRDSRIKRSGGKLSIESGYNKHPVVGVTWYGSVAYAKWVGKRLPTEAEWEVAAVGGREGVLYPTGDDIEKTQANFFSSDTIAVMSYPPNPLGLYDMAGNVYEWCYDWYGYNYYEHSAQEPTNPTGPLQGVYRVLRGGCWKSLKEDLRCSRRHRNNPGTVNGTYGFRCAADVQIS